MTGRKTPSMRHLINYFLAIVSVCAMLAVFTNCGKAKDAAMNKVKEVAVEKAIESQAAADGKKVNVDVSGDTMTVKGEDGTTKISGNSMEITSQDGKTKMVSGENAALPADFPKDVPVYPGAKVTMAASNTEDKTTTLTLESKDAVEKIADYVSKETAAQGWKEDMVIKQPGDQPLHMLGYKKDNRTLMYTISGGSDGTSISMSLQTEDKPDEQPAQSQ